MRKTFVIIFLLLKLSYGGELNSFEERIIYIVKMTKKNQFEFKFEFRDLRTLKPIDGSYPMIIDGAKETMMSLVRSGDLNPREDELMVVFNPTTVPKTQSVCDDYYVRQGILRFERQDHKLEDIRKHILKNDRLPQRLKNPFRALVAGKVPKAPQPPLKNPDEKQKIR